MSLSDKRYSTLRVDSITASTDFSSQKFTNLGTTRIENGISGDFVSFDEVDADDTVIDDLEAGLLLSATDLTANTDSTFTSITTDTVNYTTLNPPVEIFLRFTVPLSSFNYTPAVGDIVGRNGTSGEIEKGYSPTGDYFITPPEANYDSGLSFNDIITLTSETFVHGWYDETSASGNQYHYTIVTRDSSGNFVFNTTYPFAANGNSWNNMVRLTDSTFLVFNMDQFNADSRPQFTLYNVAGTVITQGASTFYNHSGGINGIATNALVRQNDTQVIAIMENTSENTLFVMYYDNGSNLTTETAITATERGTYNAYYASSIDRFIYASTEKIYIFNNQTLVTSSDYQSDLGTTGFNFCFLKSSVGDTEYILFRGDGYIPVTVTASTISFGSFVHVDFLLNSNSLLVNDENDNIIVYINGSIGGDFVFLLEHNGSEYEITRTLRNSLAPYGGRFKWNEQDNEVIGIDPSEGKSAIYSFDISDTEDEVLSKTGPFEPLGIVISVGDSSADISRGGAYEAETLDPNTQYNAGFDGELTTTPGTVLGNFPVRHIRVGNTDKDGILIVDMDNAYTI